MQAWTRGLSFAVVLCLAFVNVGLAQARGKGGHAMSFTLTSSAFSNGSTIPQKFTCSGADVSPALAWNEAPNGAKSFALIAADPDAPAGTWTHWVAWNIPATAKSLAESVDKKEQVGDGTQQGRNDFKKIGYGGPCPPPGKPHRYFFKLYALDTTLSLKPGATKAQLENAINDHILATAELMGTFSR